jgi:hypothetical protein
MLTSLSLIACTATITDGTVGGTGGTGGNGGGVAGSGGGGGTQRMDGPVAPRFQCANGDSAIELPLRRLSRLQYQNTITALVKQFAPTSGSAILTAVAPIIANLPTDAHVGGPTAKRGGYTRLDQALQQQHIDVTYQLATALGAQFTQSTQRLSEIFGACATDASTTNDAQCLDNFVRNFGGRAKRHALGADDVTFYEQPIGTGSKVDPAALADVVALILSSPGMFFFEEHGQDGTFTGRVPLDAYELAARLSYNFWNAPPDDALWQAATAGDLLTPAGYQAQVDRVVAAPPADTGMTEFFAQWLRLDALPQMNALNSNPQYAAFVGSTVPNASTTGAMVNDVLSSVLYQAHHGGGVSELLTSSGSFSSDPLLAGIYAAPASDGTTPSAVPSPARAGLLTRAAMLADGLPVTRPIMKGMFIRTALMCDTVPPPPPGACMTPPPPLPAVSTTREKTEALTEQAGTVCAGCHKNVINPLGYITENFDALGRERSQESVYDPSGALWGAKVIHTDSVLQVVPGDMRPVKDAVEATQRIDVSRKVHSCFAEQYFRYVTARLDDPQQDGCPLSSLESAAMANQPLAEVQKRAATLTEFKTRSFQ